MKIVKIQKKPWYIRFFGIEYWWAWVDVDGKIKRFSVWAGDYGSGDPSEDNFMWDLKSKISMDKIAPYIKKLKASKEAKMAELIGQEVEWPIKKKD